MHLNKVLATFAFGAGARKLGGAENVFGGRLRDFSSPLSEERTKAIGRSYLIKAKVVKKLLEQTCKR
jgi:hypothetical protein